MKIQYAEGMYENTSLSLSVASNQLVFNGEVTGDHYLTVDFPFKLSKIPPQFQSLTDVKESVLIFRNANFSQYDICEIRKPSSDGRERIGFLFKPTIIFEQDSNFLYKDDRILQTAIFRGILGMLKDEAAFKSMEVSSYRETDYSFEDFFKDDLIVGVFPFEWNPVLDSANETGLLYNLYRFGFYFLKNKKDQDFYPFVDLNQKTNFDSLPYHKSSYRRFLDIDFLCDKLTRTNYCQYYIQEAVKERGNEITKFHQIYGLIEIFKDEVLRYEINEKVRQKDIFSTDLTGHKLHKKILEISNDAYCVDKLFSKYQHGSKDLIDISFLKLFYFIEKYRDKTELESITDFPQLLYYLRNIIVHDIQFLFPMNESISQQLREELKPLIRQIEFTVLETLTSVRFQTITAFKEIAIAV